MATINTTGAGGNADRLNPTIQTTLGRLGRALTIRDGKGAADVPVAGDSVQISPAAANASAGGVGQIGAILADLESLVSQAAQDGAGADVRAEAQRRIDEAVAAISQIAGSGSVGEVGSRLNPTTGYVVQNQRDDVSSVKVSSELLVGERVDVEVLVASVEQAAGYFLSFGGTQLDLGTGSTFVFAVGGPENEIELSFASGTSLQDVASAINTFEGQTGVQATVSGTGVRVDSVEVGPDSLLTLRIIDDGSIARGKGIYGISDIDPGASYNTAAIAFANATMTLTDQGLDTVAYINGAQAIIVDNNFSASLLDGRLDVSFDIDAELGFHRQDFPAGELTRVFTVVGAQPAPSYTTDRSDLIESLHVVNQVLERGETFDVNLDITQAAERAGVGLVLGSTPGDPDVVQGAGAFEITGNLGTRGIAFEKGMTYQEYAERINSFTEFTGARAVASGAVIRIESLDFGDDQVVRVRTLEQDGLDGVYSRIELGKDGGPTLGHTAGIGNASSIVHGFEDRGVHLNAEADGVEFSFQGRHASGSAFGGRLTFDFDIATGGDDAFAVPPGFTGTGISIHAFTIHGADGVNVDGPIDDIPLPVAAPVSQALAGYASSGANAGDFDGALDAIRKLLLDARTDDPGAKALGPLIRSEVLAGAGSSVASAGMAPGRVLDLLEGTSRAQRSKR